MLTRLLRVKTTENKVYLFADAMEGLCDQHGSSPPQPEERPTRPMCNADAPKAVLLAIILAVVFYMNQLSPRAASIDQNNGPVYTVSLPSHVLSISTYFECKDARRRCEHRCIHCCSLMWEPALSIPPLPTGGE
jgi:hypothetical protein